MLHSDLDMRVHLSSGEVLEVETGNMDIYGSAYYIRMIIRHVKSIIHESGYCSAAWADIETRELGHFGGTRIYAEGDPTLKCISFMEFSGSMMVDTRKIYYMEGE